MDRVPFAPDRMLLCGEGLESRITVCASCTGYVAVQHTQQAADQHMCFPRLA